MRVDGGRWSWMAMGGVGWGWVELDEDGWFWVGWVGLDRGG